MSAPTAANIQVFGGAEEAPDDLARRVARALRDTLKEEGFEAVGVGDASDRELAVVIPADRGWVTVLDEAGDGQPETIETLARALSQSLGVMTVSVVGDGRTTSVGLHGGGATLSRLPDESGEAVPHAAWGELLAGGNTADDLAALWTGGANGLQRTAELLCVEASLWTVNYAALGRLGRSGARLRFKSTGAMVTTSGPRLRVAAKPGSKLQPAPGAPFVIELVAQNRGAPAKGMEVTLRGRLLTEEWLEVRTVKVSVGGDLAEQKPQFRIIRNDRVIQARFDQTPLPSGGPTGVINLTLDCQLTRAMPQAGVLQVALEPLGSAAGGCSAEVSIGPSAK